LMTMERVVSPLAHRFRPQMLLVSAGFDTHWRDPLANLLVSCAGVYRVVRRLAEIADAVCAGRMCLTLEGGYDPQALGGCVQSALCAAACLPQPTDPLGPAPYDETDVEGVMAKVRAIHGV
jgi:acetoin utilization deacetylase AcuC-like enzyme